jgi:hypothetical protein
MRQDGAHDAAPPGMRRDRASRDFSYEKRVALARIGVASSRVVRVVRDRESRITSGELNPGSRVDSHPSIVIPRLLRIAMHFGASYIRDADMTVRSRITSHSASSISQFTAFALHD